jgi:hypothetical protein
MDSIWDLFKIYLHWLAGLPVEFSAMLSAPLRAEARKAGLHLCVTPFNGDYVGYVLPPAIYDTDTYEARMNFIGPWGGEYFADLIRTGAGIVPHEWNLIRQDNPP